MESRNLHVTMAIVSIVAGALIALVGFGAIPVPPEDVHAPGWILALAGAVFVFAGLAILFRGRPVVAALAGNLIVAAFAAIGLWIAVAGSDDQMSGGLPFVSRETNLGIGRFMFGAGGLICLLILIPGVRQLARLMRADDDSKAGQDDRRPS